VTLGATLATVMALVLLQVPSSSVASTVIVRAALPSA
jgi:hypothetical protein